MFLHNTLVYKLRPDLSINTIDNESLAVEIINKKTKNVIVHALYRPPCGKIKPFKKYLKNTFLKNKSACKTMYLVGDFNLNVLDYKINKKIQNFFDLIFQHGLIPIINKPTRITKRNATAIDHIITNSYLSSKLKTGIIKTDISDHFPIFLVFETPDISTYPSTTTIFKRYINDKSIKQLNLLLNEVNWDNVLQTKCPNIAYESFLETFLCLYEKAFPKVKINIKTKSLLSPWMTKGLLKSIFKQIKNKSKKNYYQNLLIKYQNNIKKTWDIIKEVIGKTKLKSNILPRRLIINSIETYDKKIIANEFNNYFVNVGPNLASNIPPSSKHFETYLNHNESSLLEGDLTDEELKTAYFSLTNNKSPGYDEISANVIINTFKNISKPLRYIFNESLSQGIFPEKLKIARITPIFKSDDETSVSNYRPISVLPCFSKIIERIMYNRLYTFLCEKQHTL